jgi:Protein of unknown function (DUF3300)
MVSLSRCPMWMRGRASVVAAAALLTLCSASISVAQEAEEPEAAAAEDDGLLSADELRVVVAPIAFYPDDVLAVVLPASTTGIQVVQAERFLEKQKSDPSLKPNEEWDPSILALINYPDVITLLNADLDWTERLGNAVLDQQGDVMDAIQQARAEAAAAGYLKSDDKQTVTQTADTVVIQSADPEVVYVPQYDPQVVVEQNYTTYPPPAYYNPYPPYYSPGATFFAGAITGAAFAYAFNWGNDDIDVNFNGEGWGGDNVNINTGDVNIGNKIDTDKFNGDRVRDANGDKVKWNPDKQRKKRDTASTKRRNASAAPLGKASADKAKQQRTGKKKNQVGAKAGKQNRSGLGNPQTNRKTVKDSKRGNESLKKQQRSGSGSQLKTSKKRASGGAFGGQGSGSKAKAQKNRGQKSLGSKPRRRG